MDDLQSKVAELERINARLVVSSHHICFWLVADSYLMYACFVTIELEIHNCNNSVHQNLPK